MIKMVIYLLKMLTFHIKMPGIELHFLLPSIGGDKNPRWDDPPFAAWRIGGLGIQQTQWKNISQMYLEMTIHMYVHVCHFKNFRKS